MDQQFRIVRLNQRLRHLTGRDAAATHVGRSVRDLFPQKNLSYDNCPYCEGRVARATILIRGARLLSGFEFDFFHPSGRPLGTVHVLKDITDGNVRKKNTGRLFPMCRKASLFDTQGHFLDFNEAFLRICGYPTRNRCWRLKFLRDTSIRRIAIG